MSLELTTKQKAAIADCGCPLPRGLKRARLSRRVIVASFLAFGLALYLFWALWPPAAFCLLGIYGVLVIGNFVYRLVRGHTLSCATKWSPAAALYIIGEGIATGISSP